MNSSATEIFATALEFEGDSRTGFIADSCGGDTELRAEVEAMLADAARADDFFGHAANSVMGSIDSVPPFTEKPGDVFGPYTLLQQIGKGGFGVVWMAEQRSPVTLRGPPALSRFPQ